MMQTQVLNGVKLSLAWLECLTASRELPRRILLSTFPFAIGRTSSADLQIDSTWVSREHTLITREGSEYWARDRGSTNGTILNGERVDNAQLNDGDVLRVGDAEFTFCCREEQSGDGLQTQGADAAVDRHSPPCELVQRLRSAQEVLLHQAFRPRLWTVVELGENRAVGLMLESTAVNQQVDRADCFDFDVGHGGRMATKLQLLARLSVCEHQAHVAQETGAERIFLRVDPGELEDWDEFRSHMFLLRAAVPAEATFIIDLPAGCRYEMHQRRGIARLVEELGAGLAYHGFSGAQVQLAEYADSPPSFITIRPRMMQGTRPRQRKQRLTNVLTACRDLGTCVIVDAGGSTQELAQWKAWGLQLAVSGGELPTAADAGRSSHTGH